MKTMVFLALILCLSVFSVAAHAQVQLYAADGQYLGNITNNPYDANSISNPYGQYGSPYSDKSIHNQYGVYGSPWSSLSPNSMYPGAPYAPEAGPVYGDND